MRIQLMNLLTESMAVADLGGAPPSYGPKFSQFHAVFRKIWQNHMLDPPRTVGAPSYGGILDPPLHGLIFVATVKLGIV